MSMADYALCEQCGKKVFYDADTEVGDAAIFHRDCLTKHDAAVAERAWDEGFYAGTSGLYGPASDASEPDVPNPYERTGGE